jgi:hypothetical protein
MQMGVGCYLGHFQTKHMLSEMKAAMRAGGVNRNSFGIHCFLVARRIIKSESAGKTGLYYSYHCDEHTVKIKKK